MVPKSISVPKWMGSAPADAISSRPYRVRLVAETFQPRTMSDAASALAENPNPKQTRWLKA